MAAPHFRKRDKTVQAGFRRIAVLEIDAAIAIIDAPSLGIEDKVHKVRRQLKSLRALLRLVRPAFARFGKENRAFRDMGRQLSATRDAKVMLDTFDKVATIADARAPSRGFVMARERLAAASDASGDASALLTKIRADLVKARERADSWCLSDKDWTALSGLEQTYGHARQAMREALSGHDAEAAHEWRKGVKYLAAQARLLRRMKPGALKKDIDLATRLGDLLGERHDIDLFLDKMAGAPGQFGDIVTVTQLAGLARLRLARLDRRSAKLGTALFAERPEKRAALWRGWWEDWQGDDD